MIKFSRTFLYHILYLSFISVEYIINIFINNKSFISLKLPLSMKNKVSLTVKVVPSTYQDFIKREPNYDAGVNTIHTKILPPPKSSYVMTEMINKKILQFKSQQSDLNSTSQAFMPSPKHKNLRIKKPLLYNPKPHQKLQLSKTVTSLANRNEQVLTQPNSSYLISKSKTFRPQNIKNLSINNIIRQHSPHNSILSSPLKTSAMKSTNKPLYLISSPKSSTKTKIKSNNLRKDVFAQQERAIKPSQQLLDKRKCVTPNNFLISRKKLDEKGANLNKLINMNRQDTVLLNKFKTTVREKRKTNRSQLKFQRKPHGNRMKFQTNDILPWDYGFPQLD